jgi:hypothetical protein
MTGCGGAAMIETCHMAVSVIAQLPRQRVARDGRLGRLDFLDALELMEVGVDMRWMMLWTQVMGHGLRSDTVILWTRRLG